MNSIRSNPQLQVGLLTEQGGVYLEVNQKLKCIIIISWDYDTTIEEDCYKRLKNY